MLGAGVVPDKALASLSRSDRARPSTSQLKLARIQRQVAVGVPLSKALQQQRYLCDFDTRLIRVAESCGKLPQGLALISEHQVAKTQWLNRIKASLTLPLAVLIIGALAGLLVRVIRGDGLIESVFVISTSVLLTLLCFSALLRMLSLDIRYYLSIAWSMPVVSYLFKHLSVNTQACFEQVFYRTLVWQFNAGVAYDQALTNNATLLSSRAYKASVKQAARSISAGDSVSTALRQNQLVLTERLRQTLRVADDTGTFGQAVSRALSVQRQRLELAMENVVSWLPRVSYLVVLLVVSSVMF